MANSSAPAKKALLPALAPCPLPSGGGQYQHLRKYGHGIGIAGIIAYGFNVDARGKGAQQEHEYPRGRGEGRAIRAINQVAGKKGSVAGNVGRQLVEAAQATDVDQTGREAQQGCQAYVVAVCAFFSLVA